MKRQRLFIRTSILIILVGMLAYAIYEISTEEKGKANIGDKAPNFILNTLSNEKIKLSDLRGDGVLLNFWGTYCPPCKKEMPYLESQYQKHKGTGVHILAVNVGEQRLNVENFVNEYELNFPILMDENQEVLDVYGVVSLPATFLINKDGIIIDIIPGGMTEADIESYITRIKP
jgi:peroxiredoxin